MADKMFAHPTWDPATYHTIKIAAAMHGKPIVKFVADVTAAAAREIIAAGAPTPTPEPTEPKGDESGWQQMHDQVRALYTQPAKLSADAPPDTPLPEAT